MDAAVCAQDENACDRDEMRSRTSDQISDEEFEKDYGRTSITRSQVNDRTMHMYSYIYMYI